MLDEHDAPHVAAWLAAYRTRFDADARSEELAEALTATIVAEMPDLQDEPAIVRVLGLSTRAAVRAYFDHLPLTPPEAIEAPQDAVELGRAVARRGWAAPVLLQMYRIGQRELWLPIMAEAARVEDEQLREDVLRLGFLHLSRTVDHALGRILQAHATELELQTRGAELDRLEMVEAILAGDDVSSDRALAQLQHHLHQHQTALVLWADADDVDDPVAQVEAVARQVATTLGAPQPLLVRREGRTWWGWVATAAAPDLAQVRDALDETHHDVRVAVGGSASGLAGFRSSHRDALLAQRVALSSRAQPRVTCYRDVELVACMSAEPEAMTALARRELGPLAGPGTAAQRARDTLAAYLAEGSASRAAERLGIHKNTVLYRLQQVEEQLGHLTELRRLPVQVALQVVEVHGPVE